jgi:hypothetical protein
MTTTMPQPPQPHQHHTPSSLHTRTITTACKKNRHDARHLRLIMKNRELQQVISRINGIKYQVLQLHRLVPYDI